MTACTGECFKGLVWTRAASYFLSRIILVNSHSVDFLWGKCKYYLILSDNKRILEKFMNFLIKMCDQLSALKQSLFTPLAVSDL